MYNNATISRYLWCIILSLFFMGVVVAQQQPDPRKWSQIDLRMSKVARSAEQVKVPLSVKEYVHPVTTPTTYNTAQGMLTVNPSFRVHPTTWSTQSEVPITRHPLNGNIMYGSANTVDLGVSFISEGMYLTTDGGNTWFGSDTTAAATLSQHSGDPAPVITPNGTLIISYLYGNGVGASRSTNMGATWDATDVLESGSSDKNHTFVDDVPTSPYYGRVYATWSDFSQSLPPTAVSYSSDDGATWSAYQIIHTGLSGHYDQGVNGVVGVDGTAYIFWQNPVAGSPYTGDFVGMGKSTNGGATWTVTPNIYDCNGIRGTISQKASIRTNDFPSTGIDKTNGARRGWIYSVTAEKNLAPAGSDPDIVLHRSTDGGTTWSAGIRVNQDALNNGKIQYMPWLVVDDAGAVNVIFYDDRETTSDSAMVYVARSLDGGTTWTEIPIPDSRFKPQPISGLAGGYQGDYIGITYGIGKVWPYWMSNRSGTYQAWTTSIVTTEGFGFVEGMVTTNSNPIGGVALDFIEPELQLPGASDATGYYFAGARVDTPGTQATYTLRARKFGYLDTTYQVTLMRGDTVLQDVVMTPAPGGTLSVYAHTTSGAPIKANVKVKFNGTEVINEYTDSLTGMFAAPLPVGTYEVLVDPPSPYGHKTYTNVAITENTTTPIDAELRPVVEASPTALYDTLGVGQSNTVMLTLTNTTSDSVPFRLSNDEALFRNLPKQPQFAENSPSKDLNLVVGKDEQDPRFGPNQTMGKGGPDAFGYVWIDSDEPGGPAFNWIDISTVGTPITTWSGGTDDDGHFVVTLPFTFNWYGNNYTSARIGTNGFLGFDVASTSYGATNGAIPSSASPNDAIYAFWDDLDPGAGGTVYYYYDAANSQFIVQYNNIPHYGTTTPGLYTFEIILQPNGTVLVQYLDMQQTVNASTLGIENSAGDIGLQVVYNNTYVHNNLAILYKLRGVDWLSHEPSFGTIPAMGSVNITNTFDATGLTPSTTYLANIFVDATHQDISGSVTVPASLRVIPLEGPGIAVNPLSKDFGQVIIYQTKTDSVKIRNIGTAQLNISSVVSTNGDFTTQLSSATIAPEDSAKLYITYSPQMPAGAETGEIYILSNDPLNDTMTVNVAGTAVGAPHFFSATTTLDKTLEGGVKDSILFNVGNDGTLDGNFNARAVMYSVNAGVNAIPIEVPMAIKSSKRFQPAQLFAENSPLKDPYAEFGKNEFDPRFGPLVLMGKGGPDSTGYTWIDSDEPGGPQFSWMDIRGVGDTVTLGDDVNRGPFPLGFDFTFYGNTFNSIRIVSNGFLTFTSTATGITNAAIPTTTEPNNLIAPFWDDLDLRSTNGGSVWKYFDAANNRYIVQYDSVKKYGTTETSRFTFQVIVQANGQIVYQYKNMVGTLNSATIGIENSTGTIGLQVVFNNTYVHDNLAILFSPPGVNGGGGTWLSINPTTGTVLINDSTQLAATFDATDPSIYNNPGDYYGRIEITATNSTLADSLNIPAHLFVVPPAGARLAVTPDSLGFGNVEIGANTSLSVLVKNIGGGSLNVTDIQLTNSGFSASPANFTLNSLDTQRVTVTFTAPSPGGLYSSVMSFVSNDASAPTVKLSGRSIGVAHFTASPDSFYVSHPSGPDTLSQNLTINNTGTDTLRYRIDEAGTGVVSSVIVPNPEPAYELPKGVEDPRSGTPQLMGAGGPDAFGYRWIDSDEPGGPAFNWVDITTVGTQITDWGSGTGDEGHNIQTLPFNFPFYGNTYNSVKITTNGFISFDVVSTNHTFSNVAIPSTGEPNLNIFGFWDDLDVRTSGGVYYYHDATNNRYIIEYYNAPHFSTGGPYTFQIILKPSGEILCQYLTMTNPLNSSSIGIENATGTDGLQVVYNNTYVHNNLALMFTADLYPWLSTNVTTGTLAPGASHTVQVRTHPGIELPAGTYSGRLRLSGNTTDTKNIGVRMDVTGGSPWVQVTYPNGGESFIVGQSYNITWNKNLVDSVKIEYSTDAGTTWLLINAGVPASLIVDGTHPKDALRGATSLNETGSYLWTIPNAPTTMGRVRVSDKNNSSITDMSNGNFTISSSPPATWATQTSGTTSALYSVSVVDDQVAWAVGDAGVVRRTTNGGATWSATAIPLSGQPNHQVFAVSGDVAFVCVNPSAGNDGRIYRTTTGGTSWSMVYQNTGTGAFINAVYMFDATNGLAMGDPVNSQWTLLQTTNGGTSWTPYGTLAQAGTEAGWNNSFEWKGSQLGWYGTNNSRVYYTTNGGASWQYSATPAPNSYGVSFINSQLGMLGAATGVTAASNNGGTSWSATANAGSGSALFPAGVSIPTQRWWMASGTTLYKTTDQGASWTTDHSRSGAFNHMQMKVVSGAGVIVGYAVGASGQISKYTEYLPVTAGSISGMKFEDLDADGVKDNGEPGLSGWKIYISGAMTDSTTTDANGAYAFEDIDEGDYVVSEGMQQGWYQSYPANGTHSISLTAGQAQTGVDFGNYRLASLAGRKYEDANGDSTGTNDAGIQNWAIYINGTTSDTMMTDAAGAYLFSGLRPGTYTISENQSAGWTVTQPASGVYQVNLQSGQARTGYNFGNFEFGSISGMKWKDFNGNGVKDAGEIGMSDWTINAVGTKPGNSHQLMTDANGNFMFDGLFYDTYTVTEVQQDGYTQTYPPGGMYSITITSGTNVTGKDFGNFSPDTGAFRTFSGDTIALSKDARGKIGKPVKRVANIVNFRFKLITPNSASHFLQLDFNVSANGKIHRVRGANDTVVGVFNSKRFGPVNLSVANGDTVFVEGVGSSGNPIKATYKWNAADKVSVSSFLRNQPGLPQPNALNLIEELYQQNAFGSTGLKTGVALTGTLALRYGWAQITRFSDASKSFYDGGRRHQGTPRAFDLIGSKPFVGKQASVSPKKHNNAFFAELAALRINIVASAAGKTPNGFGDLIFDDESGNMFCGKSVIQIASKADSFATFGVLESPATAQLYYDVVKMLNTSFQGTVDTVSFARKTVFKGTRRLYEVPYLHLNLTGERTVITLNEDEVVSETPVAFALEQNYPNPFNPSTTIKFSLPEDGMVTLKVFDMLGREVASLINREEMYEGEHEFEFVATNLVSGVYFYRIVVEAPNGIEDENGVVGVKTYQDVKKLLLMK
ncbi:MAG: choice-of-anchor D domain-containing protein [Ignavibacteriae bacterium]|nr:choice-of-anchor D domain-containing protein [Ignavibacteriota bacterium]